MTAFKRTWFLGRQVVPPFAETACLMQRPIGAGFNILFPQGVAGSDFNIACLGFFNRAGGRGTTGGAPATLDGVVIDYGYWGLQGQSVAPNIFGTTIVPVPSYAEYFGVSWLTPISSVLSDGGAEDFFYIRWGLST